MCRCWLLQGVGDEYTIDEPIPEELLTEDLPDAVVADDESSANDEEQSPAREEEQSPSIKEEQSPSIKEKQSPASEEHSQENHLNEDTHIDEDELRQRK